MTEHGERADAETIESTVRRRIVWGYVGGAALIVVAVLLAGWAIAEGAAPATPVTSAPSSPPASSPAGSAAASVAPSSDPASPTAAPPAGDDAPEGAGTLETTTAPVIDAFAVSTTSAECADDRSATAALVFTWSATGADEAWIAVGTTDASAVPSAAVPPSSEGYTGLAFACREEEQLYTLTVRGPGGTTSTSVTVARSLL
jgi:hypothetical protein